MAFAVALEGREAKETGHACHNRRHHQHNHQKLQAGTMPWERPWSVRTQIPVRHCGTPYKGFNILWRSMMATQHGYASPF